MNKAVVLAEWRRAAESLGGGVVQAGWFLCRFHLTNLLRHSSCRQGRAPTARYCQRKPCCRETAFWASSCPNWSRGGRVGSLHRYWPGCSVDSRLRRRDQFFRCRRPRRIRQGKSILEAHSRTAVNQRFHSRGTSDGGFGKLSWQRGFNHCGFDSVACCAKSYSQTS